MVQGALAWGLTPEGRGAYGVCLLFAGVASVVFSFGTDRAIQYFVTIKTITLHSGVKFSVLGTALGLLFAIPLCWLSVDLPLDFFSIASAEEFKWGLLLVPLLMLITRSQLLLGALQEFRFAGTALLTGSILNATLVVSLVCILGFGVKGAIAAALTSQTLVAITSWQRVNKLSRPSQESISKSLLANLGSYSLRVYPARLGVVIDQHLPVFIVAMLASAHGVGLFIAAFVLVNRVNLISDSLNFALQPQIGSSTTGRPELVARSSRLLVIVSTFLLLCVALPSKWYVPLLFSPAFSGCVPVIWILAGGVLLRSVTRPMTMYFVASGRPAYASYGTGLQVLAVSFAIPFLYSRSGIPGAALGVVIGQAVEALTLSITFAAITGNPWREAFIPAKADWGFCWIFLCKKLALLRSK